MATLTCLSDALRSGRLKSRDVVERMLARIDTPENRGSPVYLTTYPEQARRVAELYDRGRGDGIDLPPLAGIPISIKDLFDVAGEVTRAGSRVLEGEPPAAVDAECVRRLRRAGLIILGKTNMTEFAFSGLGMNAHFGTPANPADAAEPRIPGGSSSGAAVSVAAGMAAAAIGTDTGGSCRIPAAFCGITGFKPSSTRVSRDGVVPLSRSLDSVGPLGVSVSCCARLDSILSGTGSGEDVLSLAVEGARLGVVTNYVTDSQDSKVAAAMGAALERLAVAGARLVPLRIPELDDLPALNRSGGIVGAEAFAWHRDRLAAMGERYDPWVRARIEFSRDMSAAEYIRLLDERARIRAAVAQRISPLDALVMPTVQIVAPPMADLVTPEQSNPVNLLCLRNTALANFLDVPTVSIPCHAPGALPVGLMLMGRTGEDRRLLSLASGLEPVVRLVAWDTA
jgi:aspartyl-tRNA(Asn)/glutamyl-tRNA(Gln) amidotransferase subunit A